MPGVGVDEVAAGVRRVRLDAAGADEDVYAFGAEGFDAAPEWGAAGECGVDERQDDDGDAEGCCLGQDAEGVGVADALGPFVDGVVGGRGDDDRVGFFGPWFAWFAVLAADGSAGLRLDGGLVEEVQGGGGGDDLDRPAAVLGLLDQGADGAGRACAAHDDR